MNIAVYCASTPGDDPCFREAAVELGRWIGEGGNTLVYGGSSVGIMGVIAREVMASGGCALGVEPQFFIDAGVAQEELTELIVVETMAERKAKMIELADAFVALPGGIGTLEEITEIMSCVRLGLDVAECYLLNIDVFYDPLVRLLESMVAHGFLDRVDLDRYLFPESVRELCEMVSAFQRNPRSCLATATELLERKGYQPSL